MCLQKLKKKKCCRGDAESMYEASIYSTINYFVLTCIGRELWVQYEYLWLCLNIAAQIGVSAIVTGKIANILPGGLKMCYTIW